MSIADEIHDTLHEWIRLATELEPQQIIPVRQSDEEPEPRGLYFAINVRPAVDRLGMMDDKTYTEGQYVITGHKTRLVSLQARGPGALDAMELVEAVQDAPSIRRLFKDDVLALIETRTIRDLSAKKGARTEERAQMDVIVGYGQTITDDVPTVQGVEFDIEVGLDTLSDLIPFT